MNFGGVLERILKCANIPLGPIQLPLGPVLLGPMLLRAIVIWVRYVNLNKLVKQIQLQIHL